MQVNYFTKYVEGRDVTKLGPGELTYPTKNVLLLKGKLFTRGGIVNDGTVHTEDSGVHSEFVWKDSKSGEHALRAYSNKLQIKKKGKWFTIFSGMNANTVRTRFATWIDISGSVIKKRLFFVDGSTAIHEWSGAVATVASVAGQNITISGSKTLLQLGFDPGNSTPQAVLVVRFSGGAVAGIEEYNQDDACADQVLHLTATPSIAPQAGDLIIAKPVTATIADATVAAFEKDDIYVYKNHVVVTNLESGDIYGSDAEAKLVFTIPAPGDRTAISPFFLQTDGNNQAMIARGKTGSQVLWVGTPDKWFKINALLEQNAYDQWFDIEEFTLAPRSGPLPYAAAIFDADIVYLSHDRKLRRIQTLEVLGTDEPVLLSDDVEDLLLRLDMTNVALYYESRYIWIFCPTDSNILMLDMVGDASKGIERFWQPPQLLPISCMSIIDGQRYAHSSVRNETFELFSGTKDGNVEIQAQIAFGYISGEVDHKYKQHERFSLNGRMSPSTKCKVEQFFETDGTKAKDDFTVDGSKIKFFDNPDDVSWGIVPWGFRAIGAADLVGTALKRFFAFSNNQAIAYFEFRPVLTISGENVEFQLLGWDIDMKASNQHIGNNLFIPRT